MEHINWYPGHMKKTEERISEHIKLVDVVVELVDARIPCASRNPNLQSRIGHKPNLIVLNKCDLADAEATSEWVDFFRREGKEAVSINALSGSGTRELHRILERLKQERSEAASRRALRLMIVGVPNVGKSSLINRLVGRRSAKTGSKPGVTRGVQWLNAGKGLQILDTPGVLWPKFDDPLTGLHLAFCGVIRDEVLDIATLALSLIERFIKEDIVDLKQHYSLDDEPDTPLSWMESIGKKRGHLQSGGYIDYERTARMVLDEFRSGKLGRITLERP